MITRGTLFVAAVFILFVPGLIKADGFKYNPDADENVPIKGDVGSIITLQGNAADADADTEEVRFWGYRRGFYYRPYYRSFYRPYYGGFYRPYYGGFYRPYSYPRFYYRPYVYSYNFYRPYGFYPYGSPYYYSYYYFTIDGKEGDVRTADLKLTPTSSASSSSGQQYNPYATSTKPTTGFASERSATPVRRSFAESR